MKLLLNVVKISRKIPSLEGMLLPAEGFLTPNLADDFLKAPYQMIKPDGEDVAKLTAKEMDEVTNNISNTVNSRKIVKENSGKTGTDVQITDGVQETEIKNIANELSIERGARDGSFKDLMDSDEAKRYENYWKQGSGYNERVTVDGKKVDLILDKVQGGESTRQRLYTVTGERSIKDVKLGENGEFILEKQFLINMVEGLEITIILTMDVQMYQSIRYHIIIKIYLKIHHNTVQLHQVYILIHYKGGKIFNV